MIIKVKKSWKDFVENSNHKGMTRRDFLMRGLATGGMAVALPKLFGAELLNQAYASALSCPAPQHVPGAIGQLFASGGPTMGARFISEAQASVMNSSMAANYGITGTNLLKLGPNMVIDTTSPFGFTLLQGPPGYPGGAAGWKSRVLSKISGGGHLGPFNLDDGAGQDTGLLGGMSPFKVSQVGKDIRLNVSNALAGWANGLPSVSVSGDVSPSTLAAPFGLVPAATGLTNANAMTATADAVNAITQAFSKILKTDSRKGGSQIVNSAGCSFYGNSALASPTYGATLFNPSNIPSLVSNVTLASLTSQEQAQIAAFYQSATGAAGGVVIQMNGRDYHGADPQSVIAPADIEEARAIVMFLAACDAAQAPGAMMYFANGQAIASGTQQVQAKINGATVTVNAPLAQGDAAGAYNAGLIIFYAPGTKALPNSIFTGSINSATGNATMAAQVGSSAEAVAGLYLSALTWVSGGSTPPALALARMQAAGVASRPTDTMVINNG